jgi:hypothetical protein
MAVQRAGHHAETGGDGSHAEGLRAFGADDCEGLGDDALAGEQSATASPSSGGLNHSDREPASPACCPAMRVSLPAGLTVNSIHYKVNSVPDKD